MVAPTSTAEGHVLLRGSEGLRSLGAAARSAHPASFLAELTTHRAPGVTLQTFAATEHEAVQAPARTGSPADDAVCTTFVVRGLVRVWDGDGCTDLDPGSLVCRAVAQPVHWRFLRPTTVIRSVLPASGLPSPLLMPSRLPHGPMPRTRLVAAFTALMQDIAASSSSFTTIEADYVWRAFANLEVAVIAEAVGEVDAEPVGLRTRIADHIDARLGDPDLGPETIAASLGISVRRVHREFNDGATSVARYIRDQRLDRVEAALRTELRLSRTGALSRRFGFTGPDQLARAFRARFGMTVGEYADALPVPAPHRG